MLTHDGIYWHDPCWLREAGGAERLRAACERLGGSFTIVDVLRADWISAADRVWVATRPGMLSDRILRLFAARCARRALECERAAGREPDQRSWAAVETVERFARGEATDEELVSAATAARRAAATAAARRAAATAAATAAAATAAAAAAAGDVAATWEAAWAAAAEEAGARQTKRQQQVADLLELLAERRED